MSSSSINRLILLAISISILFVILMFMTDHGSDYFQHHHHTETSSLTEKEEAITKRSKKQNSDGEENQDRQQQIEERKSSEHISVSVTPVSKEILPDFHLASDTQDSHFLKLYHHYYYSTSTNEKKFPIPLKVEYLRQLHHGIYQVKARIDVNNKGDDHADAQSANLVTFALKTECRPASKWHGQQGYTEILVNWIVKNLFGGGMKFIGPFTPGAVGGIVELPLEKFASGVHKDGCGYLKEEEVAELYGHDEESNPYLKRMKEGKSKLLIGVVLQWKPNHKDDAIPDAKFLGPWRIDKKDLLNKKDFVVKEASKEVLQMADIFVLDYIAGNEDRLEKNWFKDENGRFIAMDNGWALAGLNYAGSVCDLDLQNLKCPPLFRGIASKECSSSKQESVVNCRFRKSTIGAVKKFISLLESSADADILKHDMLIRYLAKFYPEISKSKPGTSKKKKWSNTLARFVDSCKIPSRSANAILPGGVFELAKPTLVVIDDLIRQGLLVRSKALLEHVENYCVAKFGKEDVLL